MAKSNNWSIVETIVSFNVFLNYHYQPFLKNEAPIRNFILLRNRNPHIGTKRFTTLSSNEIYISFIVHKLFTIHIFSINI